MRTLLISANRESFPEPVFPLGAVYVANSILKSGSEVRILDMRHNSSFSALKRQILGFRPDNIGISLRNIDNAAYPSFRYYLPSYASLVGRLRKIHNVPIFLGGTAFSIFPREIASQLDADGGVKGGSDGGIEVFGNAGRENIMPPVDLNEIAFPREISKIFPGFRKYRTIGIQTARGCTNGCIYCTYPNIEGIKRRKRHPDVVVDEMAMLFRDFGIRDFFIVDSLFNADEAHMSQVLEGLAALGLPLRFSCYLQPKTADPGIFRLLRLAGCVAVDFGTDSGSPRILSSLRKPFSTDDIRKASAACRKAGIDYCHSLIFGGPGETSSTLMETVRLMDEVGPKAVLAMTGIRIYPGTALARIAIEKGVIRPGESLLLPKFYFPGMGPSELLLRAYDVASGRRNWFFPGKKDWSSTLGYRFLRFFHREGPLWKTFRR